MFFREVFFLPPFVCCTRSRVEFENEMRCKVCAESSTQRRWEEISSCFVWCWASRQTKLNHFACYIYTAEFECDKRVREPNKLIHFPPKFSFLSLCFFKNEISDAGTCCCWFCCRTKFFSLMNKIFSSKVNTLRDKIPVLSGKLPVARKQRLVNETKIELDFAFLFCGNRINFQESRELFA